MGKQRIEHARGSRGACEETPQQVRRDMQPLKDPVWAKGLIIYFMACYVLEMDRPGWLLCSP